MAKCKGFPLQEGFIKACVLVFCAGFIFGTSIAFLPQAAEAKPKASKAKVSKRADAREDSARPESTAAKASAKKEDPNAPACKSEILMEASSGQVLFEQNSHTMLAPASMAKMMLLYIVMKKLDEGIIKPTDVITASAFASKIGGSQVYLKEGEQFTLEQLLEAVVIHSSNDAATAIAEYIGGSSAGFVDLMNMEAESLGMKEAKFASPHGLPPGKGQQPDLISAYDLAQLARAIVTKYPRILEISGKTEAPFRNGSMTLTNTNHLIRHYPGCDGLKTGYYVGAGFGVTATASRNGIRMITAVMGCQNGKRRFDEAGRLLSLGFSQYKLTRLIDKGTPAQKAVVVNGGEKKDTIPVASAELLTAVRPDEQKNIKREDKLCELLTAPVEANTPCGKAIFTLGTRELGSVELRTSEAIPLLSTSGKLMRMLHVK